MMLLFMYWTINRPWFFFNLLYICFRTDCSLLWNSSIHFVDVLLKLQHRFLRLLKTQNALQLPLLIFLFSASCIRNFRIVNRYSWFKKSGNMADRDASSDWVQLFLRYPCKNWYKNKYLHFYKTYDHQIWQAGTYTGFDPNEANQAGLVDPIMSRSPNKQKILYLYYHSAYDHQN